MIARPCHLSAIPSCDHLLFCSCNFNIIESMLTHVAMSMSLPVQKSDISLKQHLLTNLQTQFTALILNSALILHSCCSHVACGLQDRLLQEQQKSEQLQSQLASVQASHQQAAAAAGSQLAATQEALSQLEQEATEKLGQADMAAAEAEGQVDELTHDLEEARDAVKVISMQRTRHVIRLSCESHDWQQAAS